MHVCSAKKEEDPDGALADFRAIVDQEAEKGDWYVRYLQTYSE
jgi:COP9 signalosome complex subunit 2